MNPEALVLACSRSKDWSKYRAPACQVYTGRLFRIAYLYGNVVGLPVEILSAKHGFISPYTLIEPYEHEMRGYYRGPWPNYACALYVGGANYFRHAPDGWRPLVAGGRGLEDQIYDIRQLLIAAYKGEASAS